MTATLEELGELVEKADEWPSAKVLALVLALIQRVGDKGELTDEVAAMGDLVARLLLREHL